MYFAHNIKKLNQTTPNMSMYRGMISYAKILLTIIQLVGQCLFSQFCDVAPLVIIHWTCSPCTSHSSNGMKPIITDVMPLSNLCTFNLKHCCRLLTINWLLNAFLNICRIICLISSSKNDWEHLNQIRNLPRSGFF